MKKSKWGDYDVLTVAELIALLQQMPQEAEVWHQGCDCTGAANGVHMELDDTVLISRSN